MATGRNCELRRDSCKPNPCKEGEVCAMMANEGHKCINEKHLIVMVVEKAAVLNKKFELEKDIENLIRTTLALNRQNTVGFDASKVILFVLFSWCYKVRHCNVNVAKPVPHLAQLDQKNAPSNFTLPS